VGPSPSHSELGMGKVALCSYLTIRNVLLVGDSCSVSYTPAVLAAGNASFIYELISGGLSSHAYTSDN